MSDDRAQVPDDAERTPDTRRDISAIALLDDPLRKRLFDLVSARGTVGRDAAAQALGISRELAAFHLDRLVHGGLLVASYKRLTGRSGPGAGRPAKLYARASTDIAMSLPERRYELAAEVFATGLERLAEEIGSEPVQDAVREPAFRYGQRLGRQLGDAVRERSGGPPTRDDLVGALAGFGFEPTVEEGDVVALRNCPYRATVSRHRDLACGMNLAWAEGLLDGAGATGMEPRLDFAADRCCVVFEGRSGSVAGGGELLQRGDAR